MLVGRSSTLVIQPAARTLLKYCFTGKPPTHDDSHQQITGCSADQMIQFAKSTGLEVSLATFGMLEVLLMKNSSNVGRAGVRDEGVKAQSLFRSNVESTIAGSVASRSFSLLRTTESVCTNMLQDLHHRQPCSSRQADDALNFLRSTLLRLLVPTA